MSPIVTTMLRIEDMNCVNCAMGIDGALEDLDGVFEACTCFASGLTEVRHDATRIGALELLAAVAAAGYLATPVGG